MKNSIILEVSEIIDKMVSVLISEYQPKYDFKLRHTSQILLWDDATFRIIFRSTVSQKERIDLGNPKINSKLPKGAKPCWCEITYVHATWYNGVFSHELRTDIEVGCVNKAGTFFSNQPWKM